MSEHNQEHPLKAGPAMNTEHPLNTGPFLNSTASNTGATTVTSTAVTTTPDATTDQPTVEALNQQRAIGGLLAVIGIGMGYFTVFRPLQDAAQGAPSLSLSMKMTAITPVLIIYGITLLLLPNFALRHLGGHQSRMPKTALGWAFAIALFALGFVFWSWMQSRLRAYGYSM